MDSRAAGQLTLFPTPHASLADRGAYSPEHAAERAESSGEGKRHFDLQAAVALLPTPTARLGRPGGGPGAAWHAARGRVLDDVALLLPTPTARLADAGVTDLSHYHRRNGADHGGESLPDAVVARFGDYAAAVARHEATFGTSAPEPVEVGPKGGRRLNPDFVAWMMDVPLSLLDGVPRAARLRLLGNAVLARQAAAALVEMLG